MDDSTLPCPNCGHPIALSEALAARIRHEIEAEVAAEQQRRLAQAVEQARLAATEPMRRELEALRQEAQARERALREAGERELARARDQLVTQRKQLDEARAAELTLRQHAEAVQLRERELDLELARRVDAKRGEWETQWQRLHGEEQTLKLREKERQIAELREVIDDLRRKSAQGSPERQGETLELDIEAGLAARFPRDRFRAVPKGMQGADLIHEVCDASLSACGTIVWEFKHTRAWQPAWLAKLRDDQRACGASVAVLVSVALPEAAKSGFALIDGVWVCGLATWPALAAALREQLLQVAFARNAANGMSGKMQALYQYLAGDSFRHKVEAIVEVFTQQHEQLARERRAMEKNWKERERQLDRLIASTAGMYGELRGTIGAAMAPIAALELDGAAGQDSGDAPSLPAPPR